MRILRATLLAIGLMSFMACGGSSKKVNDADKMEEKAEEKAPEGEGGDMEKAPEGEGEAGGDDGGGDEGGGDEGGGEG